MSTTADVLPIGITAQAVRELRRERWQGRVSRAAGTLNLLGIGWTVPLMRLALGDTPRAQVAELWRTLSYRSSPS
jgi:nitrate/nitrite transport system permease protein